MKPLLIAVLGLFALSSIAGENTKKSGKPSQQEEQFRESKKETRELMKEQFEPNTEGLKQQQQKADRKLRKKR